jgi:hypothetical protein
MRLGVILSRQAEVGVDVIEFIEIARALGAEAVSGFCGGESPAEGKTQGTEIARLWRPVSVGPARSAS